MNLTVLSAPANGSAVINGDNTVSYTPDLNFNGADQFFYTVSDGDLADTGTVNVIVDPVSDTPVFQDSNGNDITGTGITRSVDENTDSGQNIGNPVSAAEFDGQDLIYALGDTTDDAAFGIVSDNGQLQTKSGLDHEKQSSYQITVTATDTDHNSASIAVTVDVSNVNEPPAASNDEVTTNEDVAGHYSRPGQRPPTSTRSRRRPIDNSPNQRSLPTEQSPSNQRRQTRCPTTPDLNFNGADQFFYTVSDGDLTNTGTVNVTVTPVEDDPFFGEDPTEDQHDPVTRHINENTGTGQNIGDPVNATEPDGQPLTYTLDGADATAFSIDHSSGQLKTEKPLDYENKDAYSVTVTATDTHGGQDQVDVVISVGDVDEPPATPSAPSVTAASLNGVWAAWNEPVNTGPIITGYNVQHRERGNTNWINLSTAVTVTETNIEKLKTSRTYEVRIRAINDEGASDWSPAGIGVTDSRPARQISKPRINTPVPTPEKTQTRIETTPTPVPTQTVAPTPKPPTATPPPTAP